MYHLSQDLGESNNLAAEKLGRVAEMKKQLDAWRQDAVARMPIANPNYDPQRAHQWRSMKTATPVDSDNRKRFPQTEKD